MPKIRFLPLLLLAFGLASWGLAPAMADGPPTVTISGPTYITVYFGQCTTVYYTATTNFTPVAITWKEDGVIVGSGSTYTRTYCSPELYYVTTEDHTLGVWAWITHEVDVADSQFTRAIFEAGTSGGGCGTQVICEP